MSFNVGRTSKHNNSESWADFHASEAKRLASDRERLPSIRTFIYTAAAKYRILRDQGDVYATFAATYKALLADHNIFDVTNGGGRFAQVAKFFRPLANRDRGTATHQYGGHQLAAGD